MFFMILNVFFLIFGPTKTMLYLTPCDLQHYLVLLNENVIDSEPVRLRMGHGELLPAQPAAAHAVALQAPGGSTAQRCS